MKKIWEVRTDVERKKIKENITKGSFKPVIFQKFSYSPPRRVRMSKTGSRRSGLEKSSSIYMKDKKKVRIG